MRSREEVAAVLELVKAGWNDCEIARELGIPRGTVRDWRRGKSPDFDRVRTRLFSNGWVCGVYRMRICCANVYPELIERCEQAMGTITATKVSRVPCIGCTEVASFSKHWPCLFPQHGPGRKHEQKIELVPWQQELVDRDPRPLIRVCCTRMGAGC